MNVDLMIQLRRIADALEQQTLIMKANQLTLLPADLAAIQREVHQSHLDMLEESLARHDTLYPPGQHHPSYIAQPKVELIDTMELVATTLAKHDTLYPRSKADAARRFNRTEE